MTLTNLKRRATIGLVMAPLATFAIAFGGGGDAAAFPANCTHSLWGNGATASCNGGSGDFRAMVGCKNPFGYWHTAYAPWQRVKSGASRVSCPFGYGPQWSGFTGRD